MARYTIAYSNFLKGLTEINLLLKLAQQYEKQDPIRLTPTINVLCRSAIVLLSSHLELFIKELGQLALDRFHTKRISRNCLSSQFYYHISKKTIQEIKKMEDHGKIAEKIFEFLLNDLPFWERTGPFPKPLPADLFNKGFSNPAYKKIKTYFNRFGYQDFHGHFLLKMQSKGQITINAIDNLVNLRNEIAHGSHNASQTPTDIIALMDIVKLFCNNVDDLFSKWCRINFCSIR